MKEKILVSYPPIGDAFDALGAAFDVVMPAEKAFTYDEIRARLPECSGLLSAFDMPVDEPLLRCAPHLKIVANYAVGFNNIDIDAARRLGIAVANTPDPVVEPTAEMAFGLMIDAARRISEYDRRLRQNALRWGTFNDLGTTLSGKTLGIVGMGRIGQAVARRAKAFGMNVIYHNRKKLPEEIERKHDARFAALDELLRLSDFVSLNMPLTPETHHLIDENALGQMKPTAFLINTARGAVVDEQALIAALQQGRIAGAGLDVYEFEPEIPEALLRLPNVVLTPHKGTASLDTRVEMARFAAQNILNFFAGKPFARVV